MKAVVFHSDSETVSSAGSCVWIEPFPQLYRVSSDLWRNFNSSLRSSHPHQSPLVIPDDLHFMPLHCMDLLSGADAKISSLLIWSETSSEISTLVLTRTLLSFSNHRVNRR